MSVYANFVMNPWANMSYKPNTCNKSIQSNNISFNISDFFAKVEDNNLNFNEFIINCKAISHESFLDISKKLSDIKDLSIEYDIDKFVIERISQKVQVKLKTSSSLAYIYSTENMVEKNDNNEYKNEKSYSPFQISKPIIAAINILSTFLSKNIADPNWHISFMTIEEKSLLYYHLAMILPNILSTSYTFGYQKSL